MVGGTRDEGGEDSQNPAGLEALLTDGRAPSRFQLPPDPAPMDMCATLPPLTSYTLLALLASHGPWTLRRGKDMKLSAGGQPPAEQLESTCASRAVYVKDPRASAALRPSSRSP